MVIGRGIRGGNRGVALLQALIMVNIIALTAAAIMFLVLAGTTTTVHQETAMLGSGTAAKGQQDAQTALNMIYADLAVKDPDGDGLAFVGGTNCDPSSSPPCLCTITNSLPDAQFSCDIDGAGPGAAVTGTINWNGTAYDVQANFQGQ